MAKTAVLFRAAPRSFRWCRSSSFQSKRSSCACARDTWAQFMTSLAAGTQHVGLAKLEGTAATSRCPFLLGCARRDPEVMVTTMKASSRLEFFMRSVLQRLLLGQVLQTLVLSGEMVGEACGGTQASHGSLTKASLCRRSSPTTARSCRPAAAHRGLQDSAGAHTHMRAQLRAHVALH